MKTMKVEIGGDIFYFDEDKIGRDSFIQLPKQRKKSYLHREDGPAFITRLGTNHWYQNGELHRIGGPAQEYVTDGRYHLWGLAYTESKYIETMEFLREHNFDKSKRKTGIGKSFQLEPNLLITYDETRIDEKDIFVSTTVTLYLHSTWGPAYVRTYSNGVQSLSFYHDGKSYSFKYWLDKLDIPIEQKVELKLSYS